jgi:dipeptidyl aminopeptidase/acylaminoacyl peptidase
VQSACFPPAGAADFFVLAKDVGGGEWTQLYRYDLADGRVTLLTDGRSQNSFGAWSPDGTRFAYGSTRRNGEDRDLYVVDPRDPKSDRRVAEVSGGGWSVADWSPDGRTLLVVEGLSAAESYLWLIDAQSGARTALTPRGGGRVAYSAAAFSRDGQGLYVATDRESEFQRLAYIDLATRTHTYLTTHIPWDVASLELSHDGRTLAFVTNEDGAGVLHLLDTATRRERPGPKLPPGLIARLAFGPGDRELAFGLQSARSALDVWSVDLASLELTRWTESESAVDPSPYPDAELVRWKSFDGRTISGFVYRPPARFTGRRPVLIEVHGGPEGQSRPGFLGRRAYWVNELGIAVVLPNVRGSSGYGKTFLSLDDGRRREDSVKDLGALLDWIATRPDLDATRVMITGGSYGGYMALAASVHFADRIRGAIDVVGISNFVTFLESTQAYRRDLRRVEYGDERDPQMRAFLEGIAPLRHVERITKPLFVVQGKNDPRVPFTESEQMVRALERRGSPVWFLMANDEGHGFAKKSNQDFLFYATALFVQEHLLK